MEDWKILPQLSDSVDHDKHAFRLLNDDNWLAEQKVDGERLLVHLHDGKIIGVKRDGGLRTVPPSVASAFEYFDGEWVFDGEIVKNTYHVFDMPRALHLIDVDTPYGERRYHMENLLSKIELPDTVRVLPSKDGSVDKLSLAHIVRKGGGEGLIFKKKDSVYKPAKTSHHRSKDSLKWKFVETVDCFVRERWREGKHSMEVGVIDEDTGEIVDIGSVKMTDENMAKVEVDTVVEIRYLYANSPDEPRLYQPAFLRVRTDKDKKDCFLSQLKYTNKEVISG